jgi:precorrin-4/cobalt-precorrin-4 C11-methyltransferase
MPERETLAAFAATRATLAVHLSIQNLGAVVEQASPFYGPDCPVAVVWRASWPDQRVIRATLATIEAAVAGSMERTALILIGPALGQTGFVDSALYSDDYDRRFRPQSADSVYKDSRE